MLKIAAKNEKLSVSDQTKYFLHDYLSLTVGLTDASGAVVSSASYDSFGNSTNSLTTRYQYTGREKDEFTGLNYYRARWYDANLGRFISEDPIGFDGDDVNLYGYVGNNPPNFADPTGLFPTGSDFADWLDDNIEYAREWYQGDDQEWIRNGSINTAADLAAGSFDMFRVGNGTAQAFCDCDENIYGRAAFLTMDLARASGIASIILGGATRAGLSSKPTILNSCKARISEFSSREYPKGGKTFRAAPFGNRTANPHPLGRFPHYHRQGPKYLKGPEKGQSMPGQGMRRHRPFESSPFDKSWRDRF